MSVRVYVPSDSTALSLGADDIARGLGEIDLDIEIIRNGSRGLCWLEPLLEIDSPEGRLGFANVTAKELSTLFSDGVPGSAHPRCLGLTEELPYLKQQRRLTSARIGLMKPCSLDDYRAQGGFTGLTKALEMSCEEIVACVTDSGLRGRGGAAFPTGIKWQTVLSAEGDKKYIVCNADEGDSGTYVDRLIMECDPYTLIEGIIIASLAVNADEGYIYCRAEYPLALERLQQAIELATDAGYLKHFKLQVRKAAGAYICGEETSLLESLEGKRGQVRFRPPLPAIEGLFGKPTVVNNVISLASIPGILAGGAASYQAYGSGRSRGTLTVQLAGNIKRGGLVEVPFGLSLRQLLEDFGGGTASGRPIKAVQAGGPLGAYIPPALFDTPLDYEAFKAIGAMVGHGGLVVFDDSADLGQMARFAMEFCAVESCGKCTPCRIGSVRGVEVIDRIHQGEQVEENRILLRDLCQTMIDGSLCALGGMAPFPVLSVMEHFPDEL
ncbi:MAG: SLBB domain-containing protein [Proteobacteria bacterium]|nr:SLBB domain-containing protein [Pseudomonadota bacterium]